MISRDWPGRGQTMLIAASLVALTGAMGTGGAQTPPAKKPALVLEAAGITYAGGKTIEAKRPRGATNPGGLIRVQQVPVQFLIPAEKRHAFPVVMVPGYGVSGAVFQATTSGGEGWLQHFARAGFASYATIQSNVAESGINIDPWNRAKAGDIPAAEQPGFVHWTPESFWSLFGYGPSYPQLYPGTRQPIAEVDALISAITPVDTSVTPQMQQQALMAVLEKTGPAILMSHSASGPNGFAVAKARPDLVKAIVSIEPTGCPADEADIKAVYSKIPVLAVFADQIPTRGPWVGWAASCETFVKASAAAGGVARRIVLPDDLSIPGNTHMMMVESNSAALADMLIDWIQKNVK